MKVWWGFMCLWYAGWLGYDLGKQQYGAIGVPFDVVFLVLSGIMLARELQRE